MQPVKDPADNPTPKPTQTTTSPQTKLVTTKLEHNPDSANVTELADIYVTHKAEYQAETKYNQEGGIAEGVLSINIKGATLTVAYHYPSGLAGPLLIGLQEGKQVLFTGSEGQEIARIFSHKDQNSYNYTYSNLSYGEDCVMDGDPVDKDEICSYGAFPISAEGDQYAMLFVSIEVPSSKTDAERQVILQEADEIVKTIELR